MDGRIPICVVGSQLSILMELKQEKHIWQGNLQITDKVSVIKLPQQISQQLQYKVTKKCLSANSLSAAFGAEER